MSNEQLTEARENLAKYRAYSKKYGLKRDYERYPETEREREERRENIETEVPQTWNA